MKTNGICPKCSSKEVNGPLTLKQNSKLYFETNKPLIAESFLFYIYICTDCGFFEHYIDKKELERLKMIDAK